MDLAEVVGAVPHAHVVRAAEPQQKVRVDFGICSRIQQGMQIYFTYVATSRIPITLSMERLGCTRIVRGL